MSNQTISVLQLQNELSVVLREKRLGATTFGLFHQPIDELIALLKKSIDNRLEQLKKEAQNESK